MSSQCIGSTFTFIPLVKHMPDETYETLAFGKPFTIAFFPSVRLIPDLVSDCFNLSLLSRVHNGKELPCFTQREIISLNLKNKPNVKDKK